MVVPEEKQRFFAVSAKVRSTKLKGIASIKVGRGINTVQKQDFLSKYFFNVFLAS